MLPAQHVRLPVSVEWGGAPPPPPRGGGGGGGVVEQLVMLAASPPLQIQELPHQQKTEAGKASTIRSVLTLTANTH